jgi:hypothetical protein
MSRDVVWDAAVGAAWARLVIDRDRGTKDQQPGYTSDRKWMAGTIEQALAGDEGLIACDIANGAVIASRKLRDEVK